MKSIILAAFALLPLAGSAHEPASVPNNGLYINAADYGTKIVTLGFDNTEKGYQISDNRWNNTVKVQQPDGKFVLPLSGLWGQRKNGADYRFFADNTYKVEYANGLFVYSKPETYSDGRLSFVVNSYYFSTSPTADIQPLADSELRDAFGSNPALAAQLEEVGAIENPVQKAQKLINLYVQTR